MYRPDDLQAHGQICFRHSEGTVVFISITYLVFKEARSGGAAKISS